MKTKEHILLGKWSEDILDNLIHEASKIKEAGERIAFISKHFLNTPYKDSTLTGDINTPEVFVINLEAMDCLTFIEYVEAMRISKSFSEFKENLKMVRYRSGVVSFTSRNHFFTDWVEFNSDLINDITNEIWNSIEKLKVLNKKWDNSYILPGIQPVHREIRYIPSSNINDSLIDKLKRGDYVGIYSFRKGLDVSHVGIIIKGKGSTYLRHASSKKGYRKVIDEDFKDYIINKPGVIILRPKNLS